MDRDGRDREFYVSETTSGCVASQLMMVKVTIGKTCGVGERVDAIS